MSKDLDLNLSHCEELPSPQELRNAYPLNDIQREFISSSRQTVRAILNGEDPRLLCILGPCSIHDITSAKEYAIKLCALSEKLSDQFFFVMRVYLEKPRTGLSWKGLLYDPLLNNSQDMPSGLAISRQLLLDLATLRVPAATEFLDIATVYYLSDLFTWGCIGARTSSSQFHRQIASGLSMPMGFKNNTDGNIAIAVDGAQVARSPHTYIGINSEGKATLLHTRGNPDSHIVLRGGRNGPNYDAGSLQMALNQLQEAHLPPYLLVDCSHDNSYRQHEKQPEVFQSVLEQYAEGNRAIRGILLESHLNAGKQALKPAASLHYGVSITDSCLDWNTTETLMHWAYDRCKNTQDLFVR